MNQQELGASVTIFALRNMPLISDGDNVGTIILDSCAKAKFTIKTGDVVVIAQKIVSKAEGALVKLSSISPGHEALSLAEATGRDPRLCQVYLDESTEIIRVKGRMVITRHKLGFECSGAGVDRSNVAPHKDEVVVLLPKQPDESAQHIRSEIARQARVDIAVIINDSFGRHDRDGSIGVAIGIAGIRHIEERRQKDLFGNPSNSQIALVDELAAAGSLLMGQANERIPVVLIRGVTFTSEEDASIQRLLIVPKIS